MPGVGGGASGDAVAGGGAIGGGVDAGGGTGVLRTLIIQNDLSRKFQIHVCAPTRIEQPDRRRYKGRSNLTVGIMPRIYNKCKHLSARGLFC